MGLDPPGFVLVLFVKRHRISDPPPVRWKWKGRDAHARMYGRQCLLAVLGKEDVNEGAKAICNHFHLRCCC